jgi:hypothetical protein
MASAEKPEEPPTAPGAPQQSCSERSCLGKRRKGKATPSDETLQLCSALGCSRSIHTSCYQEKVLKKHKLDPLTIDQSDGSTKELVVCTKKCYNIAKKDFTERTGVNLPWASDGKDGPNDPNNSERILVDWLMKEGNYSMFRGGKDCGGTRKKDYAKQIADKINAAKVRIKRNPLTRCFVKSSTSKPNFPWRMTGRTR